MFSRPCKSAGDEQPLGIHINLPVASAQVENLNQTATEGLTVKRSGETAMLQVQMPRFGFRTVRIKMK